MRKRLVLFAGLCVAALVASIAFVARGDGQASAGSAGAPPVSGQAYRLPVGGAILFRDHNLTMPGYAAYAPLSDPEERTILPFACARIYFAADRGLCLEPTGTLVKQKVTILGAELQPTGEVTLQGAPSRARVSPDGRYGAVTFFVSGHSYATPGSFSTQTTIIDLAQHKVLANLERFTVTKDGKRFDSPDFNFWGVTFASDSDRFYATLSSRGTTYLVEGSVADRTGRVLRTGVECPSLSPDGKRIAFKKRIGPQRWRLHALDLGTLRDWPLAETRSVDDQAEWLDGDNVLYAIENDVWVVPADGTGTPRLFARSADSPAVVPAQG